MNQPQSESTDQTNTQTQPAPKRSRLMGIGLAMLFLVGSSVFFVKGLDQISLAFKSSAWPTVEGVITESKVVHHTGTHDYRKDDTYQPVVQYTFTVDQTEYASDRIGYRAYTSFHDQEDAMAVAEQYPKGKQVMVSYQPDDPTQCALETGFAMHMIMRLVMCGVFFCFGLLVLLSSCLPKKLS